MKQIIDDFILTVRKLWQRELITLEELDKYTDSAFKLKKELKKYEARKPKHA